MQWLVQWQRSTFGADQVYIFLQGQSQLIITIIFCISLSEQMTTFPMVGLGAGEKENWESKYFRGRRPER